MAFISGLGRISAPVPPLRAKSAGDDHRRPPGPPRRTEDEEGSGEPDGADAAREPPCAKPWAGPNAAHAEALRLALNAQAGDADQGRRMAEAALSRMRTAQIVRAVQEAGRISGIAPPPRGLTGEILGPDDASGDDAQVIDVSSP